MGSTTLHPDVVSNPEKSSKRTSEMRIQPITAATKGQTRRIYSGIMKTSKVRIKPGRVFRAPKLLIRGRFGPSAWPSDQSRIGFGGVERGKVVARLIYAVLAEST